MKRLTVIVSLLFFLISSGQATENQAVAYKYQGGNQTIVGSFKERVWLIPLKDLPPGGKIKVDQNSGRFFTKSDLNIEGADPENKKDFAVWLGPVTTKTLNQNGEDYLELRQKVQGLQPGSYKLPGQFVGVDSKGKPSKIFTSAGPTLTITSGLKKGDKGQLVLNPNAAFELSLKKLWWLLALVVLIAIGLFLYIYYRPQIRKFRGRLAESAIIEPGVAPLEELLTAFREIQGRYPGAVGDFVTESDIRDAQTALYRFLARVWKFDTEGLTEGRFFKELAFQEVNLTGDQSQLLKSTFTAWSGARFGGSKLSLVDFFGQMNELVTLATVLIHKEAPDVQ